MAKRKKAAEPKMYRVNIEITHTAAERVDVRGKSQRRKARQQASYDLEMLYDPLVTGDITPLASPDEEYVEEPRTVRWGLDISERAYNAITAFAKKKNRSTRQQASYDLEMIYNPSAVAGAPEGWKRYQELAA